MLVSGRVHPWRLTLNIIFGGLLQIMFLSFHRVIFFQFQPFLIFQGGCFLHHDCWCLSPPRMVVTFAFQVSWRTIVLSRWWATMLRASMGLEVHQGPSRLRPIFFPPKGGEFSKGGMGPRRTFQGNIVVKVKYYSIWPAWWILRKINEHFDDTLEKVYYIYISILRMQMTGAMKKNMVGWVI